MMRADARRLIQPLFATLCPLVIFPECLQAQYVDPGSTSVLWQLLVAAVIGGLFTMRHLLARAWRSLISFLRIPGSERSKDE